MFKKYLTLYGIAISLLLLFVATQYYPGGSQFNKNSVGYSWANNYLCNLFSVKAVNGLDNASRPWAISGMLFLCTSLAWVFIEFSNKIPAKGASMIIRYCGAGAMFFAFLVVTPYHDIMVTIGCTMAPISMFYIAVFVLKSRLLLLKICSIACLLVFYTCEFCYYTSTYLALLPILQKSAFAITIVWVLSLQYFTTLNDFEPRKMQ